MCLTSLWKKAFFPFFYCLLEECLQLLTNQSFTHTISLYILFQAPVLMMVLTLLREGVGRRLTFHLFASYEEI